MSSSWPLGAVAQRGPGRSAPRARRGAAGLGPGTRPGQTLDSSETQGDSSPRTAWFPPSSPLPPGSLPAERGGAGPVAPPGDPGPGRRRRRRSVAALPAGRSGSGPAAVGPGRAGHSSWLTSAGEPRLSGGFSASRARSCSESCSLLGMEFFLGRPLGLVGDSRPPPCSTCEAGREHRGGQPSKSGSRAAPLGRSLPRPRAEPNRAARRGRQQNQEGPGRMMLASETAGTQIYQFKY